MMSQATDMVMQAEIEAANAAVANFNAKVMVFHTLSGVGNFKQAEDARVEAMNYIEAAFDTFSRVYYAYDAEMKRIGRR